jgi:hypothetical protein
MGKDGTLKKFNVNSKGKLVELESVANPSFGHPQQLTGLQETLLSEQFGFSSNYFGSEKF